MTAAFQAYCADTIHLAAYHGNEQRVIELLKANPDPDDRDSYGGTALHAAMFQDNTRIVELLIDAGFDVNAVGQEMVIHRYMTRCGEITSQH